MSQRLTATDVNEPGRDGVQGVFAAWTERETWRGSPEWLSWLPDICEELCAGEEPAGPGLAAWLLDREIARAHERCIAARERRTAWLDVTAFASEAGNVAQVLSAAARLGDHELLATATGSLAARKPGFPMLLRLAVLREGIAQAPEFRALLVETELYRGVIDELGEFLSQPARDANDWSIEHALGCTCGDCAELALFLRSSGQRLDWPLNKERRDTSTVCSKRTNFRFRTRRGVRGDPSCCSCASSGACSAARPRTARRYGQCSVS